MHFQVLFPSNAYRAGRRAGNMIRHFMLSVIHFGLHFWFFWTNIKNFRQSAVSGMGLLFLLKVKCTFNTADKTSKLTQQACRQGRSSSVWFSITKRKTRNRMHLISYKENSPPCVWHIQQKGLRTSLHQKWGQSLFEFEIISRFMFTNLQKIDKLLLFHEIKN